MKEMRVIIELDVPEWQIGKQVEVFFPDTMMKKGVCELLKEQEAVKPKTGHWNGSECSNCHATFVRSVFDKPEYCSHCGAKMEGR